MCSEEARRTGAACVDWLGDALLVAADAPAWDGFWFDDAGQARLRVRAVRIERLVRLRRGRLGKGEKRGDEARSERRRVKGVAHLRAALLFRLSVVVTSMQRNCCGNPQRARL
jgi:hypothetical protein